VVLTEFLYLNPTVSNHIMIELHSAKVPPSQGIEYQLTKASTPKENSRISPWLSHLAYHAGRQFLIPLFFGRVNVTGQHNIPLHDPVILAPTHRSRWDALLVAYAAGKCVTGRDLRFMVTQTECQGIQGWLVKRLGGFPVDIKRPSVTTLRYGLDLLIQKQILVIFPEGGIYRNGEVNSLKPGIARLAMGAEAQKPGLNVKIIPIGINYSELCPTWGTNVSIHIGQEIPVSDYISGCVKLDAKRMTNDLSKSLKELNHMQVNVPSHAFANS
jgi:1-acyl-sn-glycerol-3-phosphate acyltransferase